MWVALTEGMRGDARYTTIISAQPLKAMVKLCNFKTL